MLNWCVDLVYVSLTHFRFRPMLHFYTPWKTQKTKGLTEHWAKVGLFQHIE